MARSKKAKETSRRGPKRMSRARTAQLLDAYFASCASDALRRGVSFDLSREFFESVVLRRCYYCGADPGARLGSKALGIVHVSRLDRTATDRGFSPDNAAPICLACQTMKGEMTESGFMERIGLIHSHQNNGNDDDTRTFYVKERNAGMRGSAILKHIYDMVETDNLQKADVKALLLALVDEHIVEVDELSGEVS